ncbi:MAG: DUF1425 domain-containing protein [Desulfatibacillum sp.]|nr:DUF1425 domain-containing protein [Desulfatibacillum sp.]
MKPFPFRTISQTVLFFVCFFMSATLLPAQPMQQGTTVDDSHPGARLIIAGKDLHKQIKLVQLNMAPLGKLMRGQVQVQSITDNRLILEYKFDWLDKDGFLIGDGGIWEILALGPHEMRPIKSIGKSQGASKMQVTVRFPSNTLMDQRD